MRTETTAATRIISLTLAIILFLVMALYLPGPMEAYALPAPAYGQPYDGVDIAGLTGDGIYYGAYNHVTGADWDPTFGNYTVTAREQEATPILWRVMGEESGNLLLFSEYALDIQQFQPILSGTSNSWEKSPLRDWLHDDFAGSFHGAELATIPDNVEVKSGSELSGGTYDHMANTALDQRFYLPYCSTFASDTIWFWGNDNQSGPSLVGAGERIGNLKGGTPVHYWLRDPMPGTPDWNVFTVNRAGSLAQNTVNRAVFVRPVFQLDPTSIIYASPVVDGGDKEIGQTPGDSDAYIAGAGAGANYKLTVVNDSLGSLDNTPADGAPVNLQTGQTLWLTNLDPSGRGGDYTVNYKIVDNSTRTIVRYGFTDAEEHTQLKIDGLPEGSYTVYTWLQRNNGIRSHEGTRPGYFTLQLSPSGATYAISLDTVDPLIFDARMEGYAPVDEKTVTITQTGTAIADNLQAYLSGRNADSFVVSPVSGSQFTIAPKAGLTEGDYKAIVTVSGEFTEPQEFEVRFAVTEAEYPVVTGISPSGGGVPLGASSLSVSFDRDMDTATPTSGKVLINHGATVENGVWQPDNRTITYDLQGLAYDTTYTVSVSDFADALGMVMAADSTHTFATESEPSSPAALALDSLENDTVAEGAPYSKTVSVNYTGALPLGYSASGLPDGLDINTGTGRISGSPAPGAATGSPYTVRVSVTDGALTDTGSYTLDVTAAPTPAQLRLTPPGDDTVKLGNRYYKTLEVAYTGSGTLSYDIAGLPSGIAYSRETGAISGVPDKAGVFEIDITVDDGAGLSDTGGYTLTVEDSGGPGPETYAVTVSADPVEGGSPAADPANAAHGQTVTLTANPNSGWRFTGWSSTSPGVVFDNRQEARTSFAMPDNAVAVVAGYTRIKEGGGSGSDGNQGGSSPDGNQGGSSPGGNQGGSSGSGGRSGSRSTGSTSSIRAEKKQISASSFSWDGRSLVIDSDGVSPLGLLKVEWDGKETTAYRVYAGSVIIRFDENFIQTQSVGAHSVLVEFLNHTAEATVTVDNAVQGEDVFSPDNNTYNPSTGGYPDNGADNPNTGDGGSPWPALLICSVGATVLVVCGGSIEHKSRRLQ